MAEHRWIAEQSFRCVRPDGVTLAVVVRLGEPVEVRTEPDRVYARCRIGLAPLAHDRWGAGNNAFQALCLSLDYVRTVFKVFVAEGGRVYWADSGSIVDLQSPWFAPLPSLAEIGCPDQAESAGDG
jgi:hypothetical protein